MFSLVIFLFLELIATPLSCLVSTGTRLITKLCVNCKHIHSHMPFAWVYSNNLCTKLLDVKKKILHHTWCNTTWPLNKIACNKLAHSILNIIFHMPVIAITCIIETTVIVRFVWGQVPTITVLKAEEACWTISQVCQLQLLWSSQLAKTPNNVQACPRISTAISIIFTSPLHAIVDSHEWRV